MSRIVQWFRTSFARTKPPVEQSDFSAISEMLTALAQEDGIVPGHP